MTTCDHERLWALAVGVLEPEDSREQEEHLAACAECQAHLGEIRADVEALGFLSHDLPPEGLAQSILERSRRVQQRGRRLRWLAILAVLVASLALALTIAHGLTEKALVRRDIWRLEHALQRHQNASGRYPASEAELYALLPTLQDTGLTLDADGRPLDARGHVLRYRFPGARNPGLFDVWSLGANGIDEDGRPDDETNGPR